jgi:hypothetical protein
MRLLMAVFLKFACTQRFIEGRLQLIHRSAGLEGNDMQMSKCSLLPYTGIVFIALNKKNTKTVL